MSYPKSDQPPKGYPVPEQTGAPGPPAHSQHPAPQSYQEAQPQSQPYQQQHQQPEVPQHPQEPQQAQQAVYHQPVEQAAYNTPFAQSEMTMPPATGSGGKAVLWAAIGGVGVVVVMVVGFLVYRSVQDPFRTLDTFPAEKYLSNYETIVGSRFRAKLTVVAELGGSFDEGRLLSFRDESSQRSLAVLVSPDLGQVGFSKGQSYLAEIEVKNGGLIHAHAFKKN